MFCVLAPNMNISRSNTSQTLDCHTLLQSSNIFNYLTDINFLIFWKCR